MVEIEINGKKLTAESGSMIIEAADKAGIYIPRFCYHKKLSIAANCRMCLVEVEKSPKPLPACATPITNGMKVLTKSTKALEAQKYVMEFLLINHPLDCPICDQGGECELQDISMGFGRDTSKFTEKKRSDDDEDFGPLIATDMTRCIHCTRCIRFTQEIAGIREIGMIGRGNESQVATYVRHSLTSELSGNIIDLCPVGALTSKPYRFRARPWELKQHKFISPHDCVGSNLFLHTKNNKVMRLVPHDNETINETWASDRDRFSYLGFDHPDRLRRPLIKHQGQWQETEWIKALEYAAKGLREVITSCGPEQIAGLLSPCSTVEEGYLFQKILRDLGCDNIDFRVRQQDFADDGIQPLIFEGSIADFSEQQSIFLIGSNIRREQPILSSRIHSAVQEQDAWVASLNVYHSDYAFPLATDWAVHPQNFVYSLAEIAKALHAQESEFTPEAIKKELQTIHVSSQAEAIAKGLVNGERKRIIIGALALNHPNSSVIRGLARLIAKLTGAKLAELTEGPNARGLYSINAIPKTGLSARSFIEDKKKAYVLFNLEPEYDCANPSAVATAMKQANFVVAFSAYHSTLITENADVILPMVPLSETDGSFINVEGRLQSVQAAANCLGEARPGWKILRVLANLLELTGYQYNNAEQILKEAQQHLVEPNVFAQATTIYSGKMPVADGKSTSTLNLTRIGEWPLYRSDAVVRRAQALQNCGAADHFVARLNTVTAQKFNLNANDRIKVRQDDHATEVLLEICDNLPNNCLYLAAAFPGSAKLGDIFGAIQLEKL